MDQGKVGSRGGNEDRLRSLTHNTRILPLDKDAISQIHSSKHITSLQGVAFALLENSLDAGSGKVKIGINFRRGNCVVEDDGSGIPSREFLPDGGLGKMYHTSKQGAADCSHIDVHGSTGTYLASLAALALVIITSRQQIGKRDEATITYHHGRVIARNVDGQQHESLLGNMSHGTTVEVRNLFGNMPVRVKQRALAAETASEDERAWFELKAGITALLLAWPLYCAVTIEDTDSCNNERRKLRISGLSSTGPGALTAKHLGQMREKQPRVDFKTRTLSVLFQAGLALAESRPRWISVAAATDALSVKGIICLDPAPSKHCQFLALGAHPWYRSSNGQNEFYDIINKVFGDSSFGIAEDGLDADEVEKDRRKHDRRFKRHGYTHKQLRSRRGIDRWPMFVLHVKLADPQQHFTAIRETGGAQSKAIADILKAACTEWLAAHNFNPYRKKRKGAEQQASPAGLLSEHVSMDMAPSRVPGVSPNEASQANAVPASCKRLKHIDMSGRPSFVGTRPSSASTVPSTAFSSWSSIKSGRKNFYDDLWEAKKPGTAPDRSHPKDRRVVKHSDRAFNDDRREVGQLGSSVQQGTSTGVALRSGKLSTGDGDGELSIPTVQCPSDDFGSLDDEALVAALEEFPRDNIGVANTADDRLPMVEDNGATEEEVFEWTDPVSQQAYYVNARTGVVLPNMPGRGHRSESEVLAQDGTERTTAAINTSVTAARKPLRLSMRTGHAPNNDRPPTKWLPGFLQEWQNPVFARQEGRPIPCVGSGGLENYHHGADHSKCTSRGLLKYASAIDKPGTSSALSKASFEHARVIGQVDRKFILCQVPAVMKERMSLPCNDMLVIVDQHAASERLILEQLLSELCTPVDGSSAPGNFTTNTGCKSSVSTALVDQPLRFQVSQTEQQLFKTHARKFARWGILYDLHTASVNPTASQVKDPGIEHKISVRALPPGIVERCKAVPRLLIELLRREIWTLADNNTGPLREVDGGPEHHSDQVTWLSRIGTCPSGIIDMLNSRACRSAIMFNDPLTTEQCEDLVARLAACAFPFICAHGRCSMVPLVEFGNEGAADMVGMFEDHSAGHWLSPFPEEKGSKSFTLAFRDWHDGRLETREDNANDS